MRFMVSSDGSKLCDLVRSALLQSGDGHPIRLREAYRKEESEELILDSSGDLQMWGGGRGKHVK